MPSKYSCSDQVISAFLIMTLCYDGLTMNPHLTQILEELKSLSNPKTKAIYTRQGVQEEILGVNKGPLRKMGQTFGINHALAMDLWNTNIFEARILAVMLFDPKQMTIESTRTLIESSSSITLIDELTLTIFEEIYPRIDILDAWKHDSSPLMRRCAWNAAIANVIMKRYTQVEMENLLAVIGSKLLMEDPLVQYAQNRTLCEIGIRNDELTDRCIALGEKLGLYKEMKVAKGCTSPYAPDWITVAKRNRQRR